MLQCLISHPPSALCQAVVYQRLWKSLMETLSHPRLQRETRVKCLPSFSPTGMRKQVEGQWVETHRCGVGGERKKMHPEPWPRAAGRGGFPCSRQKKGQVGKGTAE